VHESKWITSTAIVTVISMVYQVGSSTYESNPLNHPLTSNVLDGNMLDSQFLRKTIDERATIQQFLHCQYLVSQTRSF
jgi:hypothetical protein